MIIDGKKEAQLLRDEIKKEILSIKSKNNKVPGLTVILIGDFAPSQIYVKNKEKNAKEVGINSEVIRGLGSARFTMWGVWRCLSMVKYRGTLQYEGNAV